MKELITTAAAVALIAAVTAFSSHYVNAAFSSIGVEEVRIDD